jgi:RNA polymerase sigma-70 factor (ECF subfamily)
MLATDEMEVSSNDLAAARCAWPGVDLELEAFRQYLSGRDGKRENLHDLYLACACARGDGSALAAFERRFLAQVHVYVARIETSPQFVDELRQVLRLKLLVGEPGATPKIAEYSGRGPLGAWVRVSACRTALNLLALRVSATGVAGDAAERAVADSVDPEVALLRDRYQGEFEAALREAIAKLSSRERTTLRMSAIEGASIDRIAAAYRVHRATAARWVTSARTAVLDDMHRTLRARLQLTAAELDSLAGLVRSQLHVSLGPLLAEIPESA